MNETLEVIKITIESTVNSIIENANLLFYDKFSLLLSIFAIIISIWAVYRNERSQYNNKFYDGVLLKPLQEKLPILINNAIDENNSTINDEAYLQLDDFIKEFRKDILVFKYVDNKFFEKIDNQLIQIDELLVVMSNRDENFKKNYDKLLKEVGKLYNISRKYIC